LRQNYNNLQSYKGLENSSTAEEDRGILEYQLPIPDLPQYGGLHTGLLITDPSSPSIWTPPYGITDYSPGIARLVVLSYGIADYYSPTTMTTDVYLQDYLRSEMSKKNKGK